MSTSWSCIVGPGTLAPKRRRDAFVGLDAHGQHVGFEPLFAREEHLRRALELDGDLGGALGQAFAVAQVERRARPAPVVDVQLEHDERLGPRVGRDLLLAAIARDGLAVDRPGGVLAAQGVLADLLGRDAPQGLEHLELLVAHGLGLEHHRRLHGDDRQQLQHVVLDDVAEGADLVVVAAAALDADRLGHGQLHVVDEVAIPDRLEDAIGQAKGQDVLDGLFAEVVVDSIDLRLVEDGLDRLVQRRAPSAGRRRTAFR